jgi:hypothetical protein
MCISLKDNGWVMKGCTSRLNMERIVADGGDVSDVYTKSQEAMQYARTKSRPVLLLVNNLKRRFGHAATDRQFAYMTDGEIATLADTDHLKGGCLSAIMVLQQRRAMTVCVIGCIDLARMVGVYEEQSAMERYQHLWNCTEKAFATAVNEDKITDRASLVQSNSPPFVSIPPLSKNKEKPAYNGLGA